MIESTFTITFGDQAENHVGMQKIGKLSDEGFKSEELMKIKEMFNDNAEFIDLGLEASILILRNGVNILLDDKSGADNLLNEQMTLDYDKKAFMYGRVVNKHARYNICFADFKQEPDYSNGKGRVIKFQDLKYLDKLRYKLSLFGNKAKYLMAEGNYYYDINKCFIGYHGDSERKIVIAARLGSSFPIHYQWYLESKPIGERKTIQLNHGDIYIMSEKATGNDWKKKKIMTLRHAAGFIYNII